MSTGRSSEGSLKSEGRRQRRVQGRSAASWRSCCRTRSASLHTCECEGAVGQTEPGCTSSFLCSPHSWTPVLTLPPVERGPFTLCPHSLPAIHHLVNLRPTLCIPSPPSHHTHSQRKLNTFPPGTTSWNLLWYLFRVGDDVETIQDHSGEAVSWLHALSALSSGNVTPARVPSVDQAQVTSHRRSPFHPQ